MAVRPAVAGYLLIAITPLVAGIDRGTALPALRPQEALMVLAVVALCGRAVVRLGVFSPPRPRFSRLDVAILLLAVTSSIVPLAWLALRGVQIEGDDILYALMIWKYYAVFLIFRSAIRSPAQARICLWLAMTAAATRRGHRDPAVARALPGRRLLGELLRALRRRLGGEQQPRRVDAQPSDRRRRSHGPQSRNSRWIC